MPSSAELVEAGRLAYSYDAVAWCYDAIARWASGGAIDRARRVHVERVRPGERVLYAGVGTGEDALRVVQRGAVVTAVDLSPRMLGRLAKRLDAYGLEAELVLGDVFAHEPSRSYDVVVANFFLNLYEERDLQAALAQLWERTRPGGRMWIADYARPAAGWPARLLGAAYYAPVNVAAWALGLCQLHPIHDYEAATRKLGGSVTTRVRVPAFPALPLAARPGWPAFEALEVRRAKVAAR